MGFHGVNYVSTVTEFRKMTAFIRTCDIWKKNKLLKEEVFFLLQVDEFLKVNYNIGLTYKKLCIYSKSLVGLRWSHTFKQFLITDMI